MLMAMLMVCSAVAGQVKTEVLWPGGEVRLSTLAGATAATAADGSVLMDVAEAESNKWPAVYFNFPTPRDLSSVAEVRVTLTNRCSQTLRVGLKIKGDTQQGQLPERSYTLRPFAADSRTLRLYAERWVFDKPHGLVGLKRKPHVGGGSSYSLGRVRSLSVYLPAGTRQAAIGIGRIELVSDSNEKPDVTVLKADTLCPWVDEFGQATFAEYPDKVHSEAELRARMADEEREFREKPSGIPSADRFGGWADGPQLAATGHFRTEKVDGKWWLVDPDGHLFFAHGVNYTWEQIPTGITKREHYFEKLPPETGDTARFWKTHTRPAPANHNFYSDPTNVPFKTFSFTAYSLYRKFGEGWEKKNILNNERRMRTWGLNTLTSSPLETIRTMRMPYVVGIGPGSRKIESVKGYWSSLLDPFAPEFAENCRKSARIRAELGTNEYCIGWTAHNELSWGADGAALAKSVLKAPDGQPAKVALLGILAAKGKTEATATEEDLRQLGEAVADKYYSTLRAAIKEVAPHALYLGDRNDKTNPEVFRAASRHLDVLTVNVYDYRPTRELPAGSVDKPFMVTEFHFGCYDTGYFYASLLPVKDQKTRADCYRTYLRAALDHPNYVGACWFCWRDCPISGDWNEGANAQCGLVSVTDVPYSEMVRAMRDISREMYARRAGTADCTRAIQARIDAAAAAGGGRVSLAAGDHPIGSLVLKSGVELHLEKGARLVGSRNPDDYVLDLSSFGCASNVTRRWANAMIRIIGAKNVAVTGEPGSEICGRNCFDATGEEGFRGPHAITAFGVTNLVLRGYTVRDAGNFGLYAQECANVTARDVEVHGGHDAFDFFRSSDILVEDCRLFSGDDCVAGHGNRNLTVRGCTVNSACSYFRLGGNGILIENCRGAAPAENPHRWSLTDEEKRLEVTPPGAGRRTTLSVFTFFTGRKTARNAGDIVFRNCRFAGAERLMHYNLSGSERWQQGRGLEDVTFENVTAEGLSVPVVAWGLPETTLGLTAKDCRFGFAAPVGEFVRGGHLRELKLENVTVEGVEGPAVRNWEGPAPQLEFSGAQGLRPETLPATEKFVCRQI